jgi:hypothetical protein
MEEDFISAIHNKNKIRITYFSKKDNGYVTRLCAPMDIGPHKRFPDKGDRYHVWDYDGSNGPHPSSLEPDQIRSIEALDEDFDPSEFVTWETDWTIARDWGRCS